MKSKLFIGICLALLLAILSYNYIYQDHRNIKNEMAEFSLNSSDFYNQFLSDPVTSEKKYLNKTIEVTGLITEVNSQEITLDENIFCQFSESIKNSFRENIPLKIKGRFIGYDDLLQQLKLDQSNIIN